MRPIRSIDLTVPLLLVVGVLIASNPQALVREPLIQVPVTGTIVNPCSGEEVVLGGTANVRLRSSRSVDGGFRVEVEADLSNAVATTESGTEYDLSGVATGEARTYGPYPATIQVDGQGALVNESSTESLAVRLRFQLSVEENGRPAPTGSVEVAELMCAGSGVTS